jgi:DNA polymerase III subunit gamma/tau
VLARVLRPQRFADLLGQEAVVQTLQNALAAGTVGHAYLFSGLRGVGKTTAARLLAKAVNCDRGPTPEPCGECTSCVEVTAGSSLDVVELDAATHTGVDEVRDLQEFLRFRPTRDRFRVIIVDEVHMLSRSAFNALLKSIEEPPPYVLWILATTERNKVPATVLSRCQQLEFRAVRGEVIQNRLLEIAGREGFSLSPAAAGVVARASGGSVRDALSLLDQLRAFASDQVDEAAVAAVLGVPRLEQVAHLIRALSAGDAAGGLGVLRAELEAGHDPQALYQETGRTLRVLLHLSLGCAEGSELDSEQRALLEEVARPLGATALTRMLGLWLEHEPFLREASNRELALEVAALRLSRWPAVQQLEALLASGPTGGASPTPPPAPAPRRSGPGPERTAKPRAARGQPEGGATAASRPPEPASPEPEAEPTPSARPEPLSREVAEDSGVALVRRILGGDVIAVCRDEGER